MPSRLDLSDAERLELLTIHRIKGQSEQICPDCLEKSRESVKTCFFCEGKYDDNGMVDGGDRNVVQGSLLAAMAGNPEAKKSAVESQLDRMMVNPNERGANSS